MSLGRKCSVGAHCFFLVGRWLLLRGLLLHICGLGLTDASVKSFFSNFFVSSLWNEDFSLLLAWIIENGKQDFFPQVYKKPLELNCSPCQHIHNNNGVVYYVLAPLNRFSWRQRVVYPSMHLGYFKWSVYGVKQEEKNSDWLVNNHL